MKDKLEKLNALEQDFGGEVAEIRSAVDGFHAAEAKMREKDRNLSISIVGRVKSGKSSFLNALLFKGESVLPQAATPMTAALTYIRYAPMCRAEVEFFTKKEWETFLEQSKKYDEILAQVRAKLVQEDLQLLRRTCLLYLPDGLCQSVGSTPCTHPDRSIVLLVSQTDDEFAALRVIILAYHPDACSLTAHLASAADVFNTWPVTNLLLAILLFKRIKMPLPRAT